jgi:hypothetical protein
MVVDMLELKILLDVPISGSVTEPEIIVIHIC